LAGGAMALALALGAYIGFGRNGETPATASAPQDVAVSQPPEQVLSEAPRFDELRRETDGTTVIAGRAAPLSEVRIIVDGAQVATATADTSGGFAAIALLPPKDIAQIVTLSADSEGEESVSLDEIILAPSTTLPPQGVSGDVETVQALSQKPATPEAPAAQEAPRVAVLKSDAEGVSLLNPVAEAQSAVALDTIGYSDLGEVQLTGRAQPDTAKVRIYLDNRAVISLPVGTDGRWRGDLPDVDEGVYTLRVDEVTSSGDVSSRVETPFKRESAETLAEASAGAHGPVKSITVQAGATLWAIARDRYGDGTLYVRVFEANAGAIRDPDLIYPGQVFDLPN
jgi:hypothetical protein